MFQTPPAQLPSVLFRVYHCCCEQGLTLPVTTVSLMNPPLAFPQKLSVSSSEPLICIRRSGAPCDTPHCNVFGAASWPVSCAGLMVMFSIERQNVSVMLFPGHVLVP